VTVYLVGAGPGDPGLLTMRGAEVLARADVVLYDRLAAAALLDLAPATAERISVGKTPGHPSTPQDDINRLLVEKGKTGATVVRLKGGDPYLFGRGGEEAQALLDAGVAFEVVPGVPAVSATAAYAGVPLTHRGLSTAVTVVTGQSDPWSAPETDWEAVARLGGTVVLYMAVANRADIAARLIAGGMDPATPVAAVTAGTRPEQVIVRTTVGQLGDADIHPPATIVIGAVAALDLAWFTPNP
jgi:uroporphyrin-III C-methyltransferase